MINPSLAFWIPASDAAGRRRPAIEARSDPVDSFKKDHDMK